MSHDGTAFTYTNQLACSSVNPSKREEWFECTCCPPNVLRSLGILGGCMWVYYQTGKASVDVNFYMYGSASLEFKVGNSSVSVTQESDWPQGAKIDFSIFTGDIDVTLRLRIPQWASSWKIGSIIKAVTIYLTRSQIESDKGYLWQGDLEKGFITIPSRRTRQNDHFELSIPLKVRPISTRPQTNDPVCGLARGPIMYCVEDVDNPWVNDHFKVKIAPFT